MKNTIDTCVFCNTRCNTTCDISIEYAIAEQVYADARLAEEEAQFSTGCNCQSCDCDGVKFNCSYCLGVPCNHCLDQEEVTEAAPPCVDPFAG